MIYRSIIGSRSYGLALTTSDIDVAVVSDKAYEVPPRMERWHHLLSLSPEVFVMRWSDLLKAHWGSCQWLFPHEFHLDNDLTKWIIENREDVIRVNLPGIYAMHMRAACKMERNVSQLYYLSRLTRKSIAYAIHFHNMLYNYAEGMTFAEAHTTNGETQNFLFAVRKGEAPLKLVLEENAKARERAKAVANFYTEPRADVRVLDEFKHMVYREATLLKDRGPYEKSIGDYC